MTQRWPPSLTSSESPQPLCFPAPCTQAWTLSSPQEAGQQGSAYLWAIREIPLGCVTHPPAMWGMAGRLRGGPLLPVHSNFRWYCPKPAWFPGLAWFQGKERGLDMAPLVGGTLSIPFPRWIPLLALRDSVLCLPFKMGTFAPAAQRMTRDSNVRA